MRARFRIGTLLGAVALASSMALVPAAASTATTLSMVNVTVPGPVGHWQTCYDLSECLVNRGWCTGGVR